uniref:Uncharacterized protein n=1 Tax=Arundo donax TaxID=35708 RepID=A0A0A8XZH6_ARUDO
MHVTCELSYQRVAAGLRAQGYLFYLSEYFRSQWFLLNKKSRAPSRCSM